ESRELRKELASMQVSIAKDALEYYNNGTLCNRSGYFKMRSRHYSQRYQESTGHKTDTTNDNFATSCFPFCYKS
ncbi:MAG: hypothetical protein LBV54_08235, partial [Puniceicoccales bacterium]|nr:hypothetical protein [Puniceicoccales bacterium]